MSIVTVTIELSFEADNHSALVVKELLIANQKAGKNTMLTDNTGVYDYEPDEKIIGVEVI